MSNPFSCPRCGAAAPGPGRQVCAGCHGSFSIHAGPLVDPSRVPVALGPGMQAKNPGVALVKYATITDQGVAEGTMDPIIAMVPIDTSGVWWGDIATIAVWRTPSWFDVGVAVLVPIPMSLLLFGLAVFTDFPTVVALVPAVFFAVLTAVCLWRAFLVQACRARVVGRYRTITFRFDRPARKRVRFHDELLRRAGIEPGPMP